LKPPITQISQIEENMLTQRTQSQESFLSFAFFASLREHFFLALFAPLASFA
jgi:hypothetical protein